MLRKVKQSSSGNKKTTFKLKITSWKISKANSSSLKDTWREWGAKSDENWFTNIIKITMQNQHRPISEFPILWLFVIIHTFYFKCFKCWSLLKLSFVCAVFIV